MRLVDAGGLPARRRRLSQLEAAVREVPAEVLGGHPGLRVPRVDVHVCRAVGRGLNRQRDHVARDQGALMLRQPVRVGALEQQLLPSGRADAEALRRQADQVCVSLQLAHRHLHGCACERLRPGVPHRHLHPRRPVPPARVGEVRGPRRLGAGRETDGKKERARQRAEHGGTLPRAAWLQRERSFLSRRGTACSTRPRLRRRHMRCLWAGPTVFLSCTAAASAEPELVFSLRSWEGEYETEDIPGGVRITPCTAAIHAIRADGTGLRKVVDLGAVTDAPGCSPDGRWIYFQSNATGRYRIYRCRPDGTEVTSLARDEFLGSRWLDAYGYAPSVDGKRIAYTVHDGSVGNVVVANADGSEPRLVAPELGYTYMAALSPAGDLLVFSGPARDYRLLLAPLPQG
ncbi:MAG: hypothetical protein FJX74_17765, partial [Armatimonadetes bacterium]|nr:hypothetical protein [Armatimonadota bacterium]